MAEEKHILSPELLEMGGIILKYLQKDISPEEEALLNDWILKSEHNKMLFDALQDNDSLIAEMKLYNESVARTERAKVRAVEKTFPKSGKVKRMLWYRYAAAAVLLIMLISGYLLFNKSKPGVVKKEEEVVAKVQHDVAPGQYKAKLTLADGSTLILDSFSNNRLVQQGRTDVYTKDGQLVYEANGNKSKEVLYNTLSTAKGQTYATVLSDGSKVWLNSQSSVRYPVTFTGDIRQVEITGEAYFEVAEKRQNREGNMQKMPFLVKAHGIEIEVVGTQFNVNAYNDEEAVKTTLQEGKVKVRSNANNTAIILQPGQQARLDTETQELKKLNEVDVDEEIAWHYGYFQFGRADLKTVLRQLVRWYDVDVEYRGSIPNEEFGGKISRSNSLLQVLETLESNDVHFKLEGRRIIVSP